MNKPDKLKILFLTARLPYPIIGGDRLKPYNILSYLGKKHDVTLVSFNYGGPASRSFITELEKLGIKVHAVPLHPITAGFRVMMRMLGKPPLEVLFYTQPEYRKVVEELFEKKDFDMAFAFFMRTAEYIKHKKIKKILMAEDCRTLYQKRSYKETSNIKQKLVRYWEYKKLSKYEPDISNHFDITTLVTRHDIEAMAKANPNAKFRLLSNGTDIEKFQPPDEKTERKGILFSGKLDVWANQLMIQRITQNIMPIVWQNIPDAKLNLVGANPPESIKALKSKNINIISNVPDMAEYLQTSEVFLHPHSGGSGIQNKLLEAMACGLPVVTTPTGNQGIEGTHGVNLMIGENDEDLARHTIDILKNKELGKKISDNAAQFIVDSHSWQVVFDQLEDIFDEIYGGNENE